MANNCITAIEAAIYLLEEMKTMLLTDNANTDTPLAFLEASQDVYHHVSRAVLEAIGPVLTIKDN